MIYATTVLGPLESVAEQLLEPKILVQSREEDLKRLNPSEAAQIFEMVRGKIISGDSFETQPSGVDGITVLVKAQPTLQADLIDFLQSLPSERLGAWVVQGWEKIIVDPAELERLKNLIEEWAGIKDNAMLKAAAIGVLQTPRRSR